jgi:hypothetical protein
MIKALNKSLSFTIITCFALSQIGCSTPTTSPAKTDTNLPAGTTGTTTTNNQTPIERSILLTQKTSDGATNPIVPEDLDSVIVNGQTIKASEIGIAKNGFQTKAATYSLKFINGKFVIRSSEGDVDFKISFKLKNAADYVILPELAQLASGDLRVEFKTDASGKIIGITGGVNNNGVLDPSKPMFNFDPVTGKLEVISNGEVRTVEVTDEKTELKVKTEPVKTKLNQDELKKKQDEVNVKKPSAAAPFVGKWTYSDAIGTSIKLQIRDTQNNEISYSSQVKQLITKLDGGFNGKVKYTDEGSNTLSFESAVNGKKISGKLELVGDNSLSISFGQIEATEFAQISGQKINLSRDVN